MIRALARGNASVWLIIVGAVLLAFVCLITGIVISAGHHDDVILECVKAGHAPADCKGALRP